MISTNPLSKMKFDVPSAAAVTATRRLALQDISLYANNNKAVPSLATSLAGIKGRDDESPVRMEEETSIKAFLPQDHVHEEVRKGNKKREFELDGIGSAALGRKRSRVGDQGIVKPDISWCSKNGSAAFGPKRTRFEDRGTVSPDSVVDRYAATSRGDIGSIGHLPSDCETNPHQLHEDDPLTSSSPASSSASTQGALNDSQDTIITEPEDIVVSRVMSRMEIQQRARALILRLRLATYKVQTDQIDLPMSQLKIRTAAAQSPELPTLPSANTSRRRTPLPNGASKVPNIQVHTPFSRKRQSAIMSSPEPYLELPPPRKEIGKKQDSFATPLLPRQRQGLLNPPVLDCPASEEQLTSSVVKGRAAFGLLSLMRQ